MTSPRIPKAINFHLTKACNANCGFCFARFPETGGRLRLEESKRLLEDLRAAGAEKMNFVGGEPTIHPDIEPLIRYAKKLGFVVGIVSNGAKLPELLDSRTGRALRWVGVSLDSNNDETHKKIGRGGDGYVAQAIACLLKARDLGAKTKVNTVVSLCNTIVVPPPSSNRSHARETTTQ